MVTPTSGSCVGAAFSLTVTLNPAAVITAMTAITCSGVTFTVTPTNAVNGVVPAGTTFGWSAPSVTGGLTGGSSLTGTTNVTGLLTNPTNVQQTATYIVTPTSVSCGTGATFTVTVTVNPTAVITSMTSVTCSGVTFTVTPTQTVNGIVPANTLYSWGAPSVTGGMTGGVTGTSQANISGNLINATSVQQTATYIVTPVTSGTNCAGSSFTVTVTVNPNAWITPMTTLTCSGVAFSITPTDPLNGVIPAGTTYTWNAPTGVGISGGATNVSASTNINGNLTNTTNISRTATYLVLPTTGSCVGSVFSLTVTLSPAATITAMTAITCSGVGFTVTPTNIVNGIVPAGTTYTWNAPSVTGGLTGGLSATGAGNISGTLFNPTNVQQTATYIVTPTSCSTASTFTVTVTINPTPVITPMTTTVCGGVVFSVTPVQSTNGIVPSGTLYTWSAPTGTGFSGGLTNVTPLNTITGTLNNTTNTTVTATYIVTPVTGNCTGTPFSLTVTLDPRPQITPMTSTTCSGTLFSVTPTNVVNNIVPSGTTYTWGAPTGVGISNGQTQVAASTNIFGTLNNTTNIVRTATYLVTPLTGNGCTGSVFSVTVTVNPIASITAMTLISCEGVNFSITPTNLTNGIVPAGTTYGWSVPSVTGGMTGGSSLTGTTTISGNLVNPTNAQQTATYIVTPTSLLCGTGATFTVTVTINPNASVNALTLTACGGVAFSLTPTDVINGVIPSGTTYTWTAPTGVGFTGGQTQVSASSRINGLLTNTTILPVTATYMVTPTSGSCVGAAFSLTVTLNPAAVITAMTAITCSGVTFTVTPTNAVNGVVPAGTTFGWSAPSVTGGLTGGSSLTGTTNVTGLLTNPTNVQQTATYIVTPTSVSCGTGATFTVTVTVNPTAVITSMTSVTCSGVTFTVTPTQTVNGIVPANTLYSWGAPSVTGGMTGGVTGTSQANISGNLINATSVQQTATYIVTPVTSGTNCAGSSFTVTVTVNPKAWITPMTTLTCSGVAFSITPTDPLNGVIPAGTTYTWNAPTGVGISGGATNVSASTNINGNLTNTTNISRTATYLVLPTTGSCVGSVFSLTVTLSPAATITAMTAITCSGVGFTVTPTNIVNGIVPAGTTYTWNAPSVTGGLTGGLSATGAGNISGTLFNPTNVQQTATYIVTPTSCSTASTFTVTVTINPTPVITPMTTTVCGGVVFSVTPVQSTNGIVPSGTLYTWSAPTGTGFSGGLTNVTPLNTITGTLNNTTNTTVTATYIVTPVTGNCTGTPFSLTVTLDPRPQITPMTSTTCSGTLFSVTPTNVVNNIVPSGTTYTWGAPTGVGISNGQTQVAASTNIFGTLNNTTNIVRTATYLVTSLTGNGCTGSVFSVTVTVNPIASITAMTLISCEGVNFSITPTNLTNGIVPAGTTYGWSVPSVTGGMTGGSSLTGTTTISGNLVNPTNAQQTATYIVTPTSLLCGTGATFTVTVTINPNAIVNALSLTTCSGASFSITPTDGGDGVIPSGTTYTWGCANRSRYLGRCNTNHSIH